MLLPRRLNHQPRLRSSIMTFVRRSAIKVISYEALYRKLSLDYYNSGVYYGEWKSIVDIDTFVNQNNIQLNPSTDGVLGEVFFGSIHDYNTAIQAMDIAKPQWMNTPAPVRGEVVRCIADKLRANKQELGTMISLEMGKILSEGLGEVQEAIDICDYAVGLSRCLNGSVIPSERPGHFMMEQYHPLRGHVGIISAFNFPVAVYFWNLALSLVCGNTSLWKPHESLSLTSVAVTKLVHEVITEAGYNGAIASMICGSGSVIGDAMVRDRRIELVSFTGSTSKGRQVSGIVASRLGKSILELGGNNAMIVDESADINMAVRATLFGAVGTAGQRCTTQRRLYLHSDIYEQFINKLIPAYQSIKIGNPLDPSILCGPLHNKAAVELFKNTIQNATNSINKGRILFGGMVLSDRPGNYVTPTIIEMSYNNHAPITKEESFVPILYVMRVSSIEEGIDLNNAVSHGLSSSLFTQNPEHIFQWTGPSGSDCGIVNVNIGTSGAEIGGAFGGEKDTGGGRESGSDSWKAYMRRVTCTINHSRQLPLAQGITFE